MKNLFQATPVSPNLDMDDKFGQKHLKTVAVGGGSARFGHIHDFYCETRPFSVKYAT